MDAIDQILTHKCLKLSAAAVCVAYSILAISFLQLSFAAEKNEVLRLMGQQVSGYESVEAHMHMTMLD